MSNTLTEFIVELGLNSDAFAEEIKALGDQIVVGRREYCSYLGETMDPCREYSYKGVHDITVTKDGKKLFRFNLNKQNGIGPMSYWWTDEEYRDGKWVLVGGSRREPYYGCRDYPSKFSRQ